MRLLLTNAGSYPRVGDTPELQLLRRTHAAWERKEATQESLHAAEEALVKAAIKDQEEAGLDLITDGQIRWNDPISHLAGKLTGIELNGLLRYFDTNFYFRQPVAKGEIKPPAERLILSEFEFAKANSTKPVRPVLTGPYTLARHTIAEHAPYKQMEALTRAYAQALALEIEALAHAGADVIQLDEPAILKHVTDYPILQRAVQMLAKHKG